MTIAKFRMISSVVLLLAGLVQYAQAESADTWSGCYAGLNAEYGWANMSARQSDNGFGIGSTTIKGSAFGGQLGCDRQAANWVWGAQLSRIKPWSTKSERI